MVERDTKKGYKMIGSNVKVFTDEEKAKDFASCLVALTSDTSRNVQLLKDIKDKVERLTARPFDRSEEIKTGFDLLLSERTAEVKARYESKGWAFNF